MVFDQDETKIKIDHRFVTNAWSPSQRYLIVKEEFKLQMDPIWLAFVIWSFAIIGSDSKCSVEHCMLVIQDPQPPTYELRCKKLE